MPEPVYEEIPLDDIGTEDEKVPPPVQKPGRVTPMYYEEGDSYGTFDSGSPFVSPNSLSVETQS